MKIYHISSDKYDDRDIRRLKNDVDDIANTLKKLQKKMDSEFKKIEDGLDRRILAVIREDRLKKVRTMKEWDEIERSKGLV